jgi:hypothetical protein
MLCVDVRVCALVFRDSMTWGMGGALVTGAAVDAAMGSSRPINRTA